MGATFAIVNLADSATLSTTSGTMLLPLDNLKTAWARSLARGPANGTASIPADLTIRVDLGALTAFSCIGLVGMNDAAASGTILLSNVAPGGSELGSLAFSNGGLNGDTFGNSLWYVGTQTARYIEIFVQVFALPVGFRHVDARRLVIMSSNNTATLSDGVDFSWSITPIDLSNTNVTPRGGVFVVQEGMYRRMNFSVTGMTAAEATDLQQWISAARKTTECVVSLRTEDTDETQSNRTIYGRLTDWAPIRHTGGDTYECTSITIDETPAPAL